MEIGVRIKTKVFGSSFIENIKILNTFYVLNEDITN
jgi:hypothetical protein